MAAITTPRTCAYPGCDQPPAAPESDRGAKPKYCDEPTHNALSGHRERRKAGQVAEPADVLVADDLPRRARGWLRRTSRAPSRAQAKRPLNSAWASCRPDAGLSSVSGGV